MTEGKSVNRRVLLEKILSGVVLLGGAALKRDAIWDLFDDPTKKLSKEKSLYEAIKFLKKEYNISINISRNLTPFFFDEPTNVENLKSTVRQLLIAVSKYPKLLIQKSFLDLSLTNGITGLTEYVIKLVSGKTFNANPGLYNQITNSISLNTIMHSEMFNYFDHEFFHFIDRQVNGLLMSDEEWDKFHKKYCNCQISKKGVFGEKDADFKKIIFGFLYNPEYAKSNSVEQRAELASTLLSPYLLDESFLRSVLSGVISEETIEQYKRSFPNLTLEDFLSAMGLLSMEVKRIVEIYKQYGWTDLNVDYLIKLRDPNIGFSRGDFLSEEGKAILYNI